MVATKVYTAGCVSEITILSCSSILLRKKMQDKTMVSCGYTCPNYKISVYFCRKRSLLL